jgi:hypothetical protein
MTTTTYIPTRRARARSRVDWARIRRLAAVRWYRTKWTARRLAGWVWPLVLDAAGLVFIVAAGLAVGRLVGGPWLGLLLAGPACWALNLRIDRRIREVKRR